MTAAQSAFVQIIFAVLIVILCAYSGGRVHQWYRQAALRDAAFREGYDQASHAFAPLIGRGHDAGADSHTP